MKIFVLQIPSLKKKFADEYLRILNNTEINTIEYYDLKYYIYNKFNDYKNMSDEDMRKEDSVHQIIKMKFH